MTALLRVYDKITAPTSVSLGITVSATAYSLYCAYPYVSCLNPVTTLVSACAGVALAVLTDVFLTHNSEMKSKTERNNCYSMISLAAGFTALKDSFLGSRIINVISNSYAYFGHYPHPGNFIFPISIGFLTTTLLLQLIDAKRSSTHSVIENRI